jgi:hypothetical protein
MWAGSSIATLVTAQSRNRCGLIGCPQSFTGARNDEVIDPIVGHWGAVHGQPQRVA